MSEKNDMWERRGKNNSHIAEWLKAWITRYEFDSRAKHQFFFCSLSLFTIDFFFWKTFAYCQRYPLEILTGTGVIDYADSEYAIYFHRERFLKHRSGVICWLRFSIHHNISRCVSCLISRLGCIHISIWIISRFLFVFLRSIMNT